MALTARLELKQGQTLVMTPQLQQAIKLLQLSNLDLAAYVEQELEKNPLLERAEPEAPTPEPTANWDESAVPPGGAAPDMDHDRDAGNDGAETAEAPDAAYGDAGIAVPENWDGGYANRGGSSSFETPGNRIEQVMAEAVSLKDHLFSQINMEIADAGDRLIAAQLVGLLDEAGYLTEPLSETAARLGADLPRVESVLARLQGLDPPGIFARDLAECLALQLRERDRLDPAMQALLAHLDLLARHDFAALMKICGVDAEDIADMVKEIRALNPKPGLAFDSEIVQTVVPDVFVRRRGDGGWAVELNGETLPRVLVNTRYYAEVAGVAKNRSDKSYLSECLNSANWLAKALDQRARTILTVATELVRQQAGFFEHGVQHLRPLNLRTIAEAIEMHESTVSRVTANKYMATPRGLFELKYFFTSAIAHADGGEAHSAEAVRHRIRRLIDAEDAEAVLSDDRLVEVLKADGIDIARRTVAKYREAMGIPSSVQRRRNKRTPR